MAAIKKTPEKEPHWKIIEATSSTVKATRESGVFRFTDDVTATITSHPHGALLDLVSASRAGSGDLGQNKRNILELFAVIGVELMDVKPPEGCEGLLFCHYTPHPQETVAQFFTDPRNLEKVAPDYLSVRFKEAPDKLDIGGRLVMDMGGFVNLVAEYTELNLPKSFTIRQLSGPFDYFVHKHIFEDVGDGTVIMDRVHYRNKLGGVGRIFAGPLLAGGQLQNMFAVRSQKLDSRLARNC